MSKANDNLTSAEVVRRPRGRPRIEDIERLTFDAAMTLLDTESVRNITMEVIAEKVGVSKITLYRRWPSKAALFLDAMLDCFARRAPLDDVGPPVFAIANHLVTMSRLMRGPTGHLMRGVVGECLADNESATIIRERYIGHRRKAAIRIIDRGRADGQFQAEGKTDVLHDLLYGAMFYRVLFGVGSRFDMKAALNLFETALQPLPNWREGWVYKTPPHEPASMTRQSAVAAATARFDDGRYLRRLAQWVAVRTESQVPAQHFELTRYCTETVGPVLADIGFTIHLLQNPAPGAGPVLLATRLEDPAKPTLLIYGHGDVVRGLEPHWRHGLDPWRLTIEGDRVYGRGTADNKGQHLIAIEALAAVIEQRGNLGFNAKVFIETGEEVGSPGIDAVLRQNIELCQADVFIGLDGPRQALAIPEMRLGCRGGVAFDLVVNLRDRAHHSGHWGGVLSDAGFILAHALATIVSPTGKILVPGWTPAQIPEAVRQACQSIVFEDMPNLPKADPGWGEPGLSKAEKIFAWTSAVILAFKTGHPEGPTNAVQGEARARLQVRHTVDVEGATIIPNLRHHLDAAGFPQVAIEPVAERDMFAPSRTDPNDPWVKTLAASMHRTTGRTPNITPNSSGGNPSRMFQQELGIPVIWIPNSYAGSAQHAPDEHALKPLLREGLALMAGIFWDIGTPT